LSDVRGVWRDAELVDLNTRTTTNWPLLIAGLPSLSHGNECMPTTVLRYLFLDLSKYVMRNMLVGSPCARILCKWRQQRGLKVVLAYVTSALVKINVS